MRPTSPRARSHSRSRNWGKSGRAAPHRKKWPWGVWVRWFRDPKCWWRQKPSRCAGGPQAAFSTPCSNKGATKNTNRNHLYRCGDLRRLPVRALAALTVVVLIFEQPRRRPLRLAFAHARVRVLNARHHVLEHGRSLMHLVRNNHAVRGVHVSVACPRRRVYRATGTGGEYSPIQ